VIIAANRVNIGLTFRTTVFSVSDIERKRSNFNEALAKLETPA
jgi:hypothetical protein